MNLRNTKRSTQTIVAIMAIAAFAVLTSSITAFACPHKKGRSLTKTLFDDTLIASLNLNSAQAQQLALLKTESQQLRQDMRAQRQSMRAKVRQEMAQETPDLRAIANEKMAMHDANRTKRRQFMNNALDFYEALSAQQKKQVTQGMIARAQEHRDNKRGHHKRSKRHRQGHRR